MGNKGFFIAMGQIIYLLIKLGHTIQLCFQISINEILSFLSQEKKAKKMGEDGYLTNKDEIGSLSSQE